MAILLVSHEQYSGSLKLNDNYCFVDFWSQGQKSIKSSFLGLVLSTSGTKAESHEIEPPGIGFLDFWSQSKKVIRSSLLGLVLSTF